MKKISRGKITGSILLTAVLALSMPMTVYADTYDVAEGDVEVNVTAADGQTVTHKGNITQDNQPVITGTSNTNKVTISAEAGENASLTIRDLNIDLSSGSAAPINTSGDGNVVIELDGSSSLTGGDTRAALEKRNYGDLTIIDENQIQGSLRATGGRRGAGIGGGNAGYSIPCFITIEGGTVTAVGGEGAAGIGGGYLQDGQAITISGGTVTATGGENGAGIGGGYDGNGVTIKISGENTVVTAIGGACGAGIGGGLGKYGLNITISDGTVTAVGGSGGAGIGGGLDSVNGGGITVKNNAKLFVSGGSASTYNGKGSAIGEGGSSQGDDGVEDTPNTTQLYSTGFVSIYPAGTSADSIDPTVPGGTTTFGTLPDPNTPITPPTTSATPSNPTTGVGTITSSSANSGNSVNDSEPSSIDFVLFLESIDKQIEDNLKKLNDLFASGNVEELNALRAAGIKLDTGDWVSFRKSTYALIEQASKAGIPVTIDFIYQGQRYSTTIPAYAKVSPVSLCNEESYCGFLNLIKNYGGVER